MLFHVDNTAVGQRRTRRELQDVADVVEGSTSDMLDQLRQLGKLHTQGVLTTEEFENQKKRILGS